MKTFDDFLNTIENIENRTRLKEIFDWIDNRFPQLGKRIAWSQPMYTDHGTFILGFSVGKQHIAISPEQAALRQFSDRIAESGYSASKMIFRIKWDQAVDYKLLEDIIQFNIDDKADCETFWRK